MTFTSHLARAAPAPTVEASGAAVREVLDAIFALSPRLRSYLLDEQGRLGKHVGPGVDALPVRERVVPGEPHRPVAVDARRVPVDGRLVVTRTRDGSASFEALGRGRPERDGLDLVYRQGLEVDGSGEHLAMGSTTCHLRVGDEGGESRRLPARARAPLVPVRPLPA